MPRLMQQSPPQRRSAETTQVSTAKPVAADFEAAEAEPWTPSASSRSFRRRQVEDLGGSSDLVDLAAAVAPDLDSEDLVLEPLLHCPAS